MNRVRSGILFLLVVLCAAPAAGGPDELWDLEWDTTRTASVRVHHERGEPVSPDRLRELERAVQRLAGELGLTDAQRASFRLEPIDYLYVSDAATLSWFGVGSVDGLALAGQRRIIASRLPHEHEIVHVLAHVAISPAPPQNHPFVQEGLASYLGGHLGESPAAVLALGDDVLDRNPGLVRQLLTVRGFRDAPLPGSECYAAAARFLHYLDSMWGRSRLLSLLRLLAGFEDEVAARPASFVEVQFEGVYETSFDELLAGCDGWRRANPVAGIVATAPPGRSPDLVLSDREHRVRWWLESSGWVVAVTPLQDQLDLALRWGGAPPAPEAWTAPARRAGHELRITAEGGRLIDHGRPIVVLRWFEDPLATGVVSERAWFIPAESVGSIEVPPSADAVTLWSQPRFLVD